MFIFSSESQIAAGRKGKCIDSWWGEPIGGGPGGGVADCYAAMLNW